MTKRLTIWVLAMACGAFLTACGAGAEEGDPSSKAPDTEAETSQQAEGAAKAPTKKEAGAKEPAAAGGRPLLTVSTSLGEIQIELDPENAPVTVENFLKYVEDGHYDGTIFHRVIPGFMIQGGGFDPAMSQKSTRDPIRNEATNGLKNARGTLAMARTGVVDSATAQFFINLADNDFLNHVSTNPREYGYAVFGKVVSGLDVMDKIAAVPTGRKGGHGDVPVEPVLIQSIERQK